MNSWADLAAWAQEAQTRALTPLSGFAVGAALVDEGGQVFLGHNVEYEGCALALTLHAETFALARAFASGARRLTHLAVTAAPCGHCRQLLSLCAPDLTISVAGGEAQSIKDLLPQSFALSCTPPFPASPLLAPTDDPAEGAAWAASQAYAPFSGGGHGIALVCKGQTFFGATLESDAYNPTLTALHLALAAWVEAGRPEPAKAYLCCPERGASEKALVIEWCDHHQVEWKILHMQQ